MVEPLSLNFRMCTVKDSGCWKIKELYSILTLQDVSIHRTGTW